MRSVPRPRRSMPPRWLVALPAWGQRCADVLLRAALPALLAALDVAGVDYELQIFTDDVARVRAALPPGAPSRFWPVPPPDGAFESMSNCHRAVMDAAELSDRVLLLTADMVLSREVLWTCEQVVAAGRRIVCCVAPRVDERATAPIGAAGRELLAWAWEHRHRMTRECTWPGGRSYDVWRMYFAKDGEVAARVFLPHPLVVVPAGRRMHFSPTIDVNLTANFAPSVTHMITHPGEGAAVELSPPDKEFVETEPISERLRTRGPSVPQLIRQTNVRHRMFFSKKVVLVGTGGDCGDDEVVRRILG